VATQALEQLRRCIEALRGEAQVTRVPAGKGWEAHLVMADRATIVAVVIVPSGWGPAPSSFPADNLRSIQVHRARVEAFSAMEGLPKERADELLRAGFRRRGSHQPESFYAGIALAVLRAQQHGQPIRATVRQRLEKNGRRRVRDGNVADLIHKATKLGFLLPARSTREPREAGPRLAEFLFVEPPTIRSLARVIGPTASGSAIGGDENAAHSEEADET
jgi:hypothetical protein